jgi:ABC-type sugar transport system substrate-binding protein
MKKTVKMILGLAMVCILSLASVACSASPQASQPAATQDQTAASGSQAAASQSASAESAGTGETYSIGLAMAGLDVPFCAAMVEGAREAASKYGMDIEVQDCQWDANTQIGVIQNFITAGKDAIIIMQQVSGTLGEICKEANEADIPIIGVNRMIQYDGVEVASNVLCDNVELGYNMAQACSQMLGGDNVEAQIGVISGPFAEQPAQERMQGIEKYMKEKNVAWKIADKQDGGWSKDQAIKIVTDWLVRFPEGEIDGAIVMEPYSAIGWSEVAKSNGRDELVGKCVCNDAPKEINTAIESGIVYAAVRQDPKEQGFLSTEAAYKVLSGESVEAWWKTPLPIVTVDNLNEYPATW